MTKVLVVEDRRGVRHSIELHACLFCRETAWTLIPERRLLRCDHCGRVRPYPRRIRDALEQ